MRTTFFLAATLIAGNGFAQNIDKFVITGEAAKKALTKEAISADTAEKITQVCLDYAKKENIILSVFILNPSGTIVTAHAMDGIAPLIVETGLMRAQTALRWRDSTHNMYNQSEGIGDVVRVEQYYKLGGYPMEGGLPIIVDNQLIGAIGVSGSGGRDEECALKGLTAVIGPQAAPAKNLPPPQQFAPRTRGRGPRPEGQPRPGAQPQQ